jgi:hypothetical protein
MLTKPSEARTRNLVIFGLPTVFALGGLLTFHLGGIALTLEVLGLLTLGAVLVAWIYRPRWWGSTRVPAISIPVFGGLVIAAFADTSLATLARRSLCRAERSVSGSLRQSVCAAWWRPMGPTRLLKQPGRRSQTVKA